jgi:hypothetical protein
MISIQISTNKPEACRDGISNKSLGYEYKIKILKKMKNLDKVIVIICFFCLIGLVIWLSKAWYFLFLVLFTDDVTKTLLPEKKEKNTEKEEIIQEEEKKESK